MRDLITVQGVVLSAMPVGEYDKRIVLLTRQRGKISAFAKGARRQNSPFMAASNPFVFGNFTLYEGRTSYNLNQVSVSRQFTELARVQPGIYYGYYFLELADYFGQEGTDEREMIDLLYLTAKALLNPKLDSRLVRCVFELRTMAVQGLQPGLFGCVCCNAVPSSGETVYFSQKLHGILDGACLKSGEALDAIPLSGSALYAMQYIVATPLKNVYSFTVTEEVLLELERHIYTYTAQNTDRRFKSLAILETVCDTGLHVTR